MLSEKEILEYMPIEKEDDILFNEWAAMKKIFDRISGRAVIVRKLDNDIRFCWGSDMTKTRTHFSGFSADVAEVSSITIKNRILKFSYGRDKYCFKFESPAEASECGQLLERFRKKYPFT